MRRSCPSFLAFNKQADSCINGSCTIHARYHQLEGTFSSGPSAFGSAEVDAHQVIFSSQTKLMRVYKLIKALLEERNTTADTVHLSALNNVSILCTRRRYQSLTTCASEGSSGHEGDHSDFRIH